MSNNGEVNFISHVSTEREKYTQLRPLFGSFAEAVYGILHDGMTPDIKVHDLQSRAKTIDSFCRKVARPDKADESQPRYLNPFDNETGITDLAGVRVIVFFLRNLIPLEKFIQDEFEVIERSDIGEERFLSGAFGYSSVHFLIKLKEKHKQIENYESFKEKICEIQTRTILQHAWAEIEHDIQYKSQILHPDIKRRFLELAGVINIADREFQNVVDLHKEYQNLKDEVEDDLGDKLGDEVPESENLLEEANNTEITQENKSISKKNPKHLVDLGEYQEAIEEYTVRMNAHPSDNLLYAGRSKARYLAGDTVGAIRDIDEAIRRVPNDPRLQRLKEQYEKGNLSAFSKSAYEIVSDGHDSLRKGDATEAFGKYVRAGEKGYDPKIISFNKAMATILKKDSYNASYFLDDLSIYKDSPMECSILGLRAIISAISKTGFTRNLRALKDRLSASPTFDFYKSPLTHLESGFRNQDGNITGQLLEVFEVLQRK